METISKRKRMRLFTLALFSTSLCWMLVLGSCRDNDYDLSNIDETIGLGGGDTLTLPGNNSTRAIQMDEVLKLNNSSFVHIATNGDYELSMTDGSVHRQTVTVGSFVISGSSVESYSIPAVPGSVDKPIVTLNFVANNIDKSILALDRLTADCQTKISVSVPSTLRQISKLTLSLPSFLHISSFTLDGVEKTVGSDNAVVLNGLTSGKHSILVKVDRVECNSSTADGSNIAFDANSHKLTMKVNATLQMAVAASDLTSTSTIGTIVGDGEIEPTSVKTITGRFDKEIDYDNLGSVSLSGIPDFLEDNDIDFDLYNPTVFINFNNDLPVNALLSGVLTSTDENGKTLASVNVPQFAVAPGKQVIALQPKAQTYGADTVAVAVADLPTLIRKIPNKIAFGQIKASADGSKTSTVTLGKEYSVEAQYAFDCPLQFGENATIIYSDSINDMNDGVKKLMFVERNGKPDGGLIAEADVESCLPLYLTVEAWGVDINGQGIPATKLPITVTPTVKASADGSPVTTHITMTAIPTDNDVFRTLDAIHYRLIGAATAEGQSPVTGVTLNAYKQTLKVSGITIRKYGKVIGNFN